MCILANIISTTKVNNVYVYKLKSKLGNLNVNSWCDQGHLGIVSLW